MAVEIPSWVPITLVLIYVAIPISMWLLAPSSPTEADIRRRKRAIVVVLGDLGRSPRMCNHALSLAAGGLDVYLCGYNETKVADEMIDNPRITIHDIPVIRNTKNLPFILFGPLKVLKQHLILLKLLRSELPKCDYLLLQNPPSIPLLGVVRLYNLFIATHLKVVIDWHNLGYTILALKLGPKHPFVWIHKIYEKWFGNRAYVHLTVSVGLAQKLRTDFSMKARRMIPLHDRPTARFTALKEDEKAHIKKVHGDIFPQDGETRTIITGTSYTPDEDLYLLLDALQTYDKEVESSAETLPHLRLIITGKGPMYDEIAKEISSRSYKYVSIKQVWLTVEDYPKVLASCDLGVSLHESSSGWDLPMKIVDMFGGGIPVVSLGFPALQELVKHNENGVIVNDKEGMAKAFALLFSNKKVFDKIKQGAMKESSEKWETLWTTKVGPLFGIGEYGPYKTETPSSSDSEQE